MVEKIQSGSWIENMIRKLPNSHLDPSISMHTSFLNLSRPDWRVNSEKGIRFNSNDMSEQYNFHSIFFQFLHWSKIIFSLPCNQMCRLRLSIELYLFSTQKILDHANCSNFGVSLLFLTIFALFQILTNLHKMFAVQNVIFVHSCMLFEASCVCPVGNKKKRFW